MTYTAVGEGVEALGSDNGRARGNESNGVLHLDGGWAVWIDRRGIDARKMNAR